MVDFEMEQRHLAQSQRHLQEGRERVRQQIKVVRALRAEGQDASLAIQLLVALRDAVAVGRRHNALIEDTLRNGTAYCPWPSAKGAEQVAESSRERLTI